MKLTCEKGILQLKFDIRSKIFFSFFDLIFTFNDLDRSNL